MSLGTNQLDDSRTKLLARRAALLMASGKTDGEVATELGVSRAVLDVLKASPLFQVSVDQYDKEIQRIGVESITEDLRNDFPANRDFIRDVRDGKYDEVPKDRVQLRLQAAKMLLDKQAPNAAEKAANESAARLILDGRMLGQVLRAMKNAGALDVTTDEIEEATGETLLRIEGKTTEEFAAKYAEEAELASAEETEE